MAPRLSLQQPSGPSLEAPEAPVQSSDLPGSGSLLVKPEHRVALQADAGHQSRYNPVASDAICFPRSRLVRWAPLNFEETIVQAKLAAPVDRVFGLLIDPKRLEARSPARTG